MSNLHEICKQYMLKNIDYKHILCSISIEHRQLIITLHILDGQGYPNISNLLKKNKKKHENPLQKCQKFYPPPPPLKKEMVEGLIYKHVVKRPCASQKA